MRRLTTVLGLVAVAAMPFAARAQTTTPAQPKAQPGKPREIRPIENPKTLELWKGSQIIGQNVDDMNGKNAGKIEDLMIDANGEVVYAILSFGGFLGIGDRLYAVPWSAMHFNHENGKIKKGHLVVMLPFIPSAFSCSRAFSAATRVANGPTLTRVTSPFEVLTTSV